VNECKPLLHGPGAVVFRCGAGESVLSVLPPDVIILNLVDGAEGREFK